MEVSDCLCDGFCCSVLGFRFFAVVLSHTFPIRSVTFCLSYVLFIMRFVAACYLICRALLFSSTSTMAIAARPTSHDRTT